MNRPIRARHSARLLAAASAAALSTALPLVTTAQTWIAGSGNWNSPTNWAGGVVPSGATANATIWHADGINRVITYNFPSTNIALFGLSVRQTGTGSTTVNQAGFYLDSGSLFLGSEGRGTYQQSGGTHVTDYAEFGGGAGTNGTGFYLLSGGLFDVKSYLYLGHFGQAHMTHSGGTARFGTNLHIAYAPGSYGEYYLTGTGRLEATALEVGYGGTGFFGQSGGTSVISSTGDSLVIARGAASSGTYQLSGGSLTTFLTQVGINGSGTFQHTAGTHRVNAVLEITPRTGGTGSYTLSGSGFLDVGALWVGDSPNANAVYTQTGGRLNMRADIGFGFIVGYLNGSGTANLQGGVIDTATLFIGHTKTGVFNQSGGTNNVANPVYLATLANSFGRYNLSGGRLQAVGLYLGNNGQGTFNHSGGTAAIGAYGVRMGVSRISSGGHYNMSNGATLTTPLEIVGETGTGIFTQTGGTHTVGATGTDSLVLGAGTSSTGIFRLSGGTLATQGTQVGVEGMATFTHTGGTHTVNGTLRLRTTGQNLATYDLGPAGVVTATDVVIGDYYSHGSAENVTFTQTGGTLNVGAGTNGLTVDNGNLLLQGGAVNTQRMYVGTITHGFVKQTGGTNTVTGPLWLGNNVPNDGSPSGMGYYTLEGGRLSATTELLGGPGARAAAFNQRGGTHVVGASGSNSLVIGAVTSGFLALDGGTLDTQGTRVGAGGTGYVEQSGGVHTVHGALTIAPAAPAQGGYEIGGGTLRATAIVVGGGSGTSTTYAHFGTATTTFATNITVYPGAQFIARGGAVNVAADFANSGTLDARSGGTVTIGGGLRNVTGAPAAGTTVVGPGTGLTANFVRQDALTLTGSASSVALVEIRARASGGSTSVLRRLTIDEPAGSPAGILNLADTPLVIDYDDVMSPIPFVRRWVTAAYSPTSGVHWLSPGITSHLAFVDPARRGVGYAEASAALGLAGTQTATWQGQTVDATSILVRMTVLGDATLDGVVNFNDLVKLAQNYNQSFPLGSWERGDFTYDGTVDFGDLTRLAQNYGTSLPADAIPGAPPGFHADLARAFASVPEPSSLTALATLAATLLARVRARRPPPRAG